MRFFCIDVFVCLFIEKFWPIITGITSECHYLFFCGVLNGEGKGMQTEATEMYLITVYRLTRQAPRASTKDIATLLKISQPSVSEQLKRLTKQDYLNYQWREGATLTDKGERIAINVLRKHRLLETFLVKMADYALDEVHEEACEMEHAISDRLADRLEMMLDHPDVDPHGHPIPDKDGRVTLPDHVSLADIPAGQTVTVCQVSDWNPQEITYLQQVNLVPGTTVTVSTVAPFDGPLTLEINGQSIAIAREIAQKIGVTLIT
jgi:DtxR family Mn-dependent transcriptional regulator